VEKLVDDFKSLRQPEKFNEAYPFLLKEINRRRVFNTAMTAETDMLNKAIEIESQERKKFVDTYHQCLPTTLPFSLESYPKRLAFMR
jgi:hypothetical protein